MPAGGCGALALTAGQVGDCPQVPALLAPDLRLGQRVLANRAYDADYVRTQVAQAGAQAVIPSKKNWVQAIDHDKEIYKQCNQIERAVRYLKRFRGLATRYEKNATSFLALAALAATLL